jgi:hypothetical protein
MQGFLSPGSLSATQDVMQTEQEQHSERNHWTKRWRESYRQNQYSSDEAWRFERDERWHFLGPDCATAVASLMHVNGEAGNVVNEAEIDVGKPIPVRFGGHAKFRKWGLPRHPPKVEFPFYFRGHLQIWSSRASSRLLSSRWLIHVVAAAIVFCAISTAIC